MACEHCSDTGSLSKTVTGLLDCGHCPAANERWDIEAWHKTAVKHQQLDVLEVVWLAIQRDRQINQGEKK